MRERVLDKLPVMYGQSIAAASKRGSQVELSLQGEDGGIIQIFGDHVVAATGFQTNLRKLAFLERNVRSRIRCYDGAPELSASFETTCPGLYCIGPAAAMSFGPVMRFVAGVPFTSARLARHLLGDRKVKSALQPAHAAAA